MPKREPRHYGGLGGFSEGRPVNEDDAFEMAVQRALGDQLRTDELLCKELWGSLANVDWKHRDGHTASYSFRAAGDLIAAILGAGNYMDWYGSFPYGQPQRRIVVALKAEGWKPVVPTNR